jgi:thioredoxin reductase
VKLALSLKAWSPQVICCCNRYEPTPAERQLLIDNAVACRQEQISRVVRYDGSPVEISFEKGEPLSCDAIFFSADQYQRSQLPETLGCELDEDWLVQRDRKQHTCIDGVFVAGDARGEVQLAVVAAAEGATAATAINKMLQQQNTMRNDFKPARTQR